MNKKFALNKENLKNKNCRQFQNFILKTLLEGDEIAYCESLKSSNIMFLVKYFKFECQICFRLCSHALLVDCCKNPVCLDCSLEVSDEYERLDIRVPECLFCKKEMISTYYVFRDPYKNEKK